MAKWIDRVQSHAIHKTITDIEEALGKADSKAEEVEEAREGLVRLGHVVRHAKRVLSAADPLLVGTPTLDSLNSIAGQVLSQLNEFVSTGAAAHVNKVANNEADKLLAMLSSVIVPSSSEDVDALRAALSGFDRASREVVEGLRGQATEVQQNLAGAAAEIKQLAATIASEKKRIDEAVTQHQKQFSEGQNSRQRSFDAAEKERMEKFSQVATEQRETFAALHEGFKQDHAKLAESTSKKTDELVRDIEARRDKAKDIVGIIAGTGMAGGYKIDADEQRKAFRVWNALTVLGFGGLIGFSIWLFVATTGSREFKWAEVGARFIAILAFGLFAAYAGRMAMRYRDSEREHRHKQLALESVNAFLEDLAPDVQKDVKQKMADAFFTRSQRGSDEGQDVAPTTVEGLLKLLGQVIGKLK